MRCPLSSFKVREKNSLLSDALVTTPPRRAPPSLRVLEAVVKWEEFSIDLASNDRVAEFIASNTRPQELLLPTSITLGLDRDQVQGKLGAQSADGYVAFCLSNGDFGADEIAASYVIVTDLEGQVKNVRLGDTVQSSTSGQSVVSRFEGLKLINATTLMLARRVPDGATLVTESDATEGNRYFLLWNWETGVETALPFGTTGSHDIEYLSWRDSFIVMSGQDELVEYSAKTGEEHWSMTWKDACENYKKLRYLNSPVSATERRKACARNAHFNRVQMVDERTMCVPFPSCPLLAAR